MIHLEEITFVVQGPIHPTKTKRSLIKLREVFPGSQVILSTWEDENTNGLDADLVLLNKDPGTSVFVYSKKNEAVKVNINRQLVSTLNGLKRVTTKYAVKLRADNVLHNTNVLTIFHQYTKRNKDFSCLNHRLVCSNFFAKEYERGLPVPYFYSDFFQFGETEDLLKVWDINCFTDYEFRDELSGKKQHENYPRDSINVEQKIWSQLGNRISPTRLRDEHGTSSDIVTSRNVMLNNLIIVDGDILGLEVPERLKQCDDYPYDFYTYQRWQWLYEKAYGVNLGVPYSFKSKWLIATGLKWLRKGIRLKVRKAIRL